MSEEKTKEDNMQSKIDYLLFMEENRYNGWLVSPNFIKRVVAVFGYTMLASLLFYVLIFLVMLFFIILLSIVEGIASL